MREGEREGGRQREEKEKGESASFPSCTRDNMQPSSVNSASQHASSRHAANSSNRYQSGGVHQTPRVWTTDGVKGVPGMEINWCMFCEVMAGGLP